MLDERLEVNAARHGMRDDLLAAALVGIAFGDLSTRISVADAVDES